MGLPETMEREEKLEPPAWGTSLVPSGLQKGTHIPCKQRYAGFGSWPPGILLHHAFLHSGEQSVVTSSLQRAHENLEKTWALSMGKARP